MTCNHVYRPFKFFSKGPVWQVCLLCMNHKPEPCYFEEQGKADRERLEGVHGR